MLRRILLDNPEEAVALADRILRKVDATEGERALAAFTMLEFSGKPLSDQVHFVLASASTAEFPKESSGDDSARSGVRLLNIAMHARSDMKRALRAQRDWVSDSSDSMALLSSAFLLKSLGKCLGISGFDEATAREAGLLLSEIACRVEREFSPSRIPHISLPAALAAAECLHLSQQGVLPQSCLSEMLSDVSRKMEMELFQQQKICRMKLLMKRSVPKQTSDRSKNMAIDCQSVVVDSVRPLLRVNLFGGMDVFIGDRRLDPSLFSRRKVRTLLALLVLNGGKEYSCENLIHLMWPEKPLKSGRNNLYVVWGELRHALELPDKTCPYLIKQQQGLRIDPDLLVSDVKRFHDVCRTLLFESPSYGGWMRVHEQVMNDFSEDLLPSEDQSERIADLRASFKKQLISGLVSASRRLADNGDKRNAVWFAHTAVMRAKTREDAYAALMYAQLAAGQRTAALDTYFDCVRVLSEELGIDPSAEVTRLYRMALESEEDWEH